MKDQNGCLAGILNVFRGALKASLSSSFPPPSRPAKNSMEVFAMPSHGRTSFIWATLFMLRQLSRVWPGYLCWPLDEATGGSLVDIHEKLRMGQLPEPWLTQESESSRYALHLRNINPWGERYFVVEDRPDSIFGSELLEEESVPDSQTNWNLPALWLLSLSDLDEAQGRFLDLTLDQLIRARNESGEAAREMPFRLIVVLTKGDAIPELPPELRCFLKQDPLAQALSASEGGMFRPNDEVDLSPPTSESQPQTYPESDPTQAYFQVRDVIHERIQAWMESNSAGRALLARARDMAVDLRFSLVSATGSGVSTNGHLATSWSPRRVLDPYFWYLEMAHGSGDLTPAYFQEPTVGRHP